MNGLKVSNFLTFVHMMENSGVQYLLFLRDVNVGNNVMQMSYISAFRRQPFPWSKIVAVLL